MESSHPGWSCLRMAIVMCSLVLTLYLTASSFDDSELHAILWMFLAVAGGERLVRFAESKFK